MALFNLLIAIGGLGILAVVLFYPLALLLTRRRAANIPPDPDTWPVVAVISAARNAEALIAAKLQNFSELDYPADCLVLLVASDASTDGTRRLVEATGDSRIRLVEQSERRGKAAAMNLAVSRTDAELLLFSDADALLAPDAVKKLVRHFAIPQVGGVCGLRVSARSDARLRDAQQTYISVDSSLKQMESARGRITSNDGKLHMIRRALFSPIPPDVTDDLYTALAVIAQGFCFIFDPEAYAEVAVPSRDALHEIRRRRRIVTRSLTGILRMRRLLNPFRFGWFAIGLLVNKVGRRLLPFFLLLFAVGVFGVLCHMLAFVWIGLGVVLLSVCSRIPRLSKLRMLLLYILAGMLGSGWGVIDFLMGRRVSIWEPKKMENTGL